MSLSMLFGKPGPAQRRAGWGNSLSRLGHITQDEATIIIQLVKVDALQFNNGIMRVGN